MSVPRTGATLTEVLMSLLIMSIGVVSVISLFPISIIRAIQATQLTNGKFCEQNAEQIVTTYPTVLQGTFPRPTDIDSVAVGTPGIYGWEPYKTYTADTQFVIPPTAIGSHSPASTKIFICRDSSGSGPDIDSGGIEPDWNHPVLDSTDYDGDGLTNDYVVYDGPDIAWQVFTRARVIDPHGSLYVESGTAFTTCFGNDSYMLPSVPLLPTDPILRVDPFAGGTLAARVAQADALFALPDSWVLDLEAVPSAMTAADSASTTPGSVTLPADLPLNPATLPFGSMRITFVNLNGTEVASRLVNTAASNFLYVEFQWPDLPFSFDANGDGVINLDDIGSVRIEHFERRYTWLYSISAADANEQPRVSCVVFFNRGFSLDDEMLYPATFGNPAEDLDMDGSPDAGSFADVDGDGMQDVPAANQARIWWDPSSSIPEPTIKAGNFIFDGRSGHWYQILQINEEELPLPSGLVTWRVTLTDNVYAETPPPGGLPGRAMLMKGIIQVFDLEL